MDLSFIVMRREKSYRCKGDGWEEIAVTTDPGFNDTDVKNGRKYYYYIVAQTSEGESEPSNIIKEKASKRKHPPRWHWKHKWHKFKKFLEWLRKLFERIEHYHHHHHHHCGN
jgi:hypothetical protein